MGYAMADKLENGKSGANESNPLDETAAESCESSNETVVEPGKGLLPFGLYFKEPLEKIRIVSNAITYGPMPRPDEEVEQRISIRDGGGIWLTHYCFGRFRAFHGGMKMMKKEKIPADQATIRRILDAIGRAFQKLDLLYMVTDVGSWDIVCTNAKGVRLTWSGPLMSDSFPELSDYIREELGREDLFLFDGNPDRVDRVEVYYDRYEEIPKPKEEEEDKPEPRYLQENPTDEKGLIGFKNPGNPVNTVNYHEELKLDRAAETVEYFRQTAGKCDLKFVWHIKKGVSDFLDDLYIDSLSQAKGNPEDAYIDPRKRNHYQIVVTSKLEGEHEIEGSFDKNGLPEDWPDFAEDLCQFLKSYGLGDIFNESIYSKVRRRKDDLIFCNVIFMDRGRQYCYLSDEDHEAGDLVIVPAGDDNYEAVVKVVSVEYHPAAEAPYPLDRIKRILRTYDEKKDKNLGEFE